MKKQLVVIICMIMCLILVACGEVNNKSTDNAETESAEESEIEVVAEETENADEAENTDEGEVLEKVTKEAEDAEVKENAVDFSNLSVGDTVVFGSGDMEWQVLKVEENKALVIMKNCIFTTAYNNENEPTTWENCSLREYLNGIFYSNFFNDSERTKIIKTTIINEDNPHYQTLGGNDTEDLFFLLSLDEAETYFDSDESRVATLGEEAYDWWLRSPGYDDTRAACVRYNGMVYDGGGTYRDGNGLRPACWISMED